MNFAGATIYNPGPDFRPGSGYGPRSAPLPSASTNHLGRDFPAARGTSIPSAADGKVYDSLFIRGYGNTVIVEHKINGEKVYTLYAHLNEPSTLKKGDIIAQGQSVGNVGNTGRGTNPHLHFEVIKDQLNPLKKGHNTYDPSSFDFPIGGGGPGGGTGGGTAGGFVVLGFSLVLAEFIDSLQRLAEKIRDFFDRAQRFAPRADPLVLDLDGDGLETVGLNLASPVYFVAPAKPRRPAWNNAFAKNRYVEIPQELE